MLSLLQQQNLVELVDYEIQHFLCEQVPKYQSFNNMHIKYGEKEEINMLLNFATLSAFALTNIKTRVKYCWFNVLKENSLYEKHKHNTLAGVYYLKNCTNNGTVVFVDGVEKVLPCLDNTFQFISGDVYHKVPNYNGLDRYSVAFDLEAI